MIVGTWYAAPLFFAPLRFAPARKTCKHIQTKFCIFDVRKQLEAADLERQLGCELLSNFVSLTSENNSRLCRYRRNLVVNCFQILYL